MSRQEIAVAAVKDALQGRDIKRVEVVGSAYISDREDSDVDVLVLIPGFAPPEESFPGWNYGGSDGEGNDEWGSWKAYHNGVEVNMLITGKQEYFNQWLSAAEVCRFLHLKGYKLSTGAVHGVHEILMEDSTAVEEVKNRNY